jgi:hypothetical protein
VADHRASGNGPCCSCDLPVRDAQKNGVGISSAGILVAAERAVDLVAGGAQRGRDGTAKPSAANDGESLTARGIFGGIPFQFPHLRYRSA